MSTVGYGDVVPRNPLETAYATFVILVGALVFPALVGILAYILNSLGQRFQEFSAQVQVKQKVMEELHFPKV